MQSLLERLKKNTTPSQVTIQPSTSSYQQQQQQRQILRQQPTQDTVIQQNEVLQDSLDDLFADDEKENQPSNILQRSKAISKQKTPVKTEVSRKNEESKQQKTIQSLEKKEQQKKRNKKLLGLREPWSDQTNQLISIQPPQINTDKKSNKKYKIRLTFKDCKGKLRNYTIRFGSKKGEDFVDHKNADKRNLFALRVRNCDNILLPNFWRVMLLNNEFSSIDEAWDYFIQSHKHYFKVQG